MRPKRASIWSIAALMALVLPSVGLVSSCSKDAESTPAGGEQPAAGALQTVSAEDEDLETTADRVARITYFDGGVSSRPVGAEEWETIDLNEPVLEGYEVYADEGSHAELMLGESKYARFGDGCDLTVARLDPEYAQFELGSGVMTLDFDEWGDGEYYEVSTPAGAFVPQRAGSYRVDVLDNGDTRIVVTRGTAIVSTPDGEVALNEGDVVTLPYGTPANVDVVSNGAVAYHDDWDDWRTQRVTYYSDTYNDYYNRYDVPDSIRTFESRNDIYGVLQLAAFGLWVALDDHDRYGWQPRYAREPGWSPYSNGYWDYSPVVGWTWISREEWGWAPYHYGRWDHTPSYGWVWVPDHGGTIVTTTRWRERYTWYPSQVYFYQPPQTDYFAYVPLAPGERYIPYSATAYYSPTARVVDFRPRYLREERAIYYISPRDLELRAKPRRAGKGDLARFIARDRNDTRLAHLPKAERIVAADRVAPARLRPNKLNRERDFVVTNRSIEQAQKRDERRAKRAVQADNRQIRKAADRKLDVRKRQLQAGDEVTVLRGKNKGAKRQANAVELRGNQQAADRAGRRAERQQRRAERGQPANQAQAPNQVDRQQRKAERRAARQQNGGNQAPKVDRQQRRAERQQPRAQKRVTRQQAPKVDRQQRRAERQQQRANRVQAAPQQKANRQQQRAAKIQARPQQKANRQQRIQQKAANQRVQKQGGNQRVQKQGGVKANKRGGGKRN